MPCCFFQCGFWGLLMGAPHVACRIGKRALFYVNRYSMSHVASKRRSCHMSILRNALCHVTF